MIILERNRNVILGGFTYCHFICHRCSITSWLCFERSSNGQTYCEKEIAKSACYLRKKRSPGKFQYPNTAINDHHRWIYFNETIKHSHSRFFSQLAAHAEITYKSAIAPNLSIRKYGVNQFHYIYLMAPSVDVFGGNVTSKTFGEFVDNGGNLVVATDHTIGNGIRNVGAQFGVEFDEDGTRGT